MSFFINPAISVDDVDVLRGALQAWCVEKRVDIKSVEAQSAASAALDLYYAGHDSRDKLLVAMRNRMRA